MNDNYEVFRVISNEYTLTLVFKPDNKLKPSKTRTETFLGICSAKSPKGNESSTLRISINEAALPSSVACIMPRESPSVKVVLTQIIYKKSI